MQFQKYHQSISQCVENIEMFLDDCNYNQSYAHSNLVGKPLYLVYSSDATYY